MDFNMPSYCESKRSNAYPDLVVLTESFNGQMEPIEHDYFVRDACYWMARTIAMIDPFQG